MEKGALRSKRKFGSKSELSQVMQLLPAKSRKVSSCGKHVPEVDTLSLEMH